MRINQGIRPTQSDFSALRESVGIPAKREVRNSDVNSFAFENEASRYNPEKELDYGLALSKVTSLLEQLGGSPSSVLGVQATFQPEEVLRYLR